MGENGLKFFGSPIFMRHIIGIFFVAAQIREPILLVIPQRSIVNSQKMQKFRCIVLNSKSLHCSVRE